MRPWGSLLVVCRCSLWVQDLSHGADGIGHAPIMALGRGECSMAVLFECKKCSSSKVQFCWDLRLSVCKFSFQVGEFLRCSINSHSNVCIVEITLPGSTFAAMAVQSLQLKIQAKGMDTKKKCEIPTHLANRQPLDRGLYESYIY